MKPEEVSVADFKRDLPEYVERVRREGLRCVLARRGKRVAALVSLEDLERLEKLDQGQGNPGLLGCLGAWSELDQLEQIVDDIYTARRQSMDRPVDLEG